jgi:hypothetical protein
MQSGQTGRVSLLNIMGMFLRIDTIITFSGLPKRPRINNDVFFKTYAVLASSID